MSQTPPMTDALAQGPEGRDRTPELTSKREKRTRDPDEDDRDRSERRRRHDDERRDRDRRRGNDEEPNGDRDRDRDRDRRHRRHRDEEDDGERRRHRHRDEETDEDREERRRRRRERDERDRRASRNESKELMPDTDDVTVRSSERDRDGRRERHRDRSRESHRSHRSRSMRDPDASSRREMTREEREAEREKRDREMREERREAARIRDERFAEMDRERARERRNDRPPPPRSRSPYSPRPRRGSPVYSARGGRNDSAPPPPPREPPPPLDPATQVWNSIDSENRSIFISQIAARMTSSDLGLFFEDMLGEGSVKDARVVTDRQSQRSKGIGYVELTDASYVNKALGLSGSIVMGIPIIVQLTEAERNREGKTIEQLVAQATKEMEAQKPRYQREGRREQIHYPHLSTGLRLPPGFDPDQNPDASIPYHRLFLTNVAYSLSQDDLRAVFEPFGQIDFIDQHMDHHGSPKGTAYVQFRELRAAQMALDAMNGFELAGRAIKAMAINEKSGIEDDMDASGRGPRGYGGPKLDARGRMSLMQKLARTEDNGPTTTSSPRPPPPPQQRSDPTPFIVVSNMFNPEEETERNWDLDLAEDVKGEVEGKYGKLKNIKVDKMSGGEVYMEFRDGARFADMAVQGLNGRFFGGRQLRAEFISEALFRAHM